MYQIVPVTLQSAMVFEICLSSLDNAHFPVQASEGPYKNVPALEMYNINLQTPQYFMQSLLACSYSNPVRTPGGRAHTKSPESELEESSTERVHQLPCTAFGLVFLVVREKRSNVFQAGPSCGAVPQVLLSQSRVSVEGKPYRIREP